MHIFRFFVFYISLQGKWEKVANKFEKSSKINLKNLQNSYPRRKRTGYYGILPLRVQIFLNARNPRSKLRGIQRRIKNFRGLEDFGSLSGERKQFFLQSDLKRNASKSGCNAFLDFDYKHQTIKKCSKLYNQLSHISQQRRFCKNHNNQNICVDYLLKKDPRFSPIS